MFIYALFCLLCVYISCWTGSLQLSLIMQALIFAAWASCQWLPISFVCFVLSFPCRHPSAVQNTKLKWAELCAEERSQAGQWDVWAAGGAGRTGCGVVWCGTHLRFPLASSSSALVAVQRCLVCFVLSFPRVVWSTWLGNHGIWLARRNFLSISCTTMYRSVEKLWSTAAFPSFIPLPSVVEFTFSGAVIRWSFKSEVMTLTYCPGNHCRVSYTKGKWSWIVE